MRQAKVVADLVGAGFEVPLRVLQPGTARAHIGHAGGVGQNGRGSSDHHFMRVIQVVKTGGGRRSARIRQDAAELRMTRVSRGTVRHPHRRGDGRALPYQGIRRLAGRHVRINRVHVRDELLQGRIGNTLSLVVWEIHADDEQRLPTLCPRGGGDHAIEVRGRCKFGGLLTTLFGDQSRDRLSFILVSSHALIIPGDHHIGTAFGWWTTVLDRQARRHPRLDLRLLQNPPRQVSQGQFAIQSDPMNADAISGWHRSPPTIREGLKHPAILQGRDARDLAAALLRRCRLHQQVAAPAHRLLQKCHDVRRQFLPHRCRHRQFQRSPRILIDEVQQLLAPLPGQLDSFFQIRIRLGPTLRPAPEFLKHRLHHRR